MASESSSLTWEWTPFIVGTMRCCDVALKRLATRTDKSLTQAAEEMGEVIDRLAKSDVLDFGPAAYADAKVLGLSIGAGVLLALGLGSLAWFAFTNLPKGAIP